MQRESKIGYTRFYSRSHDTVTRVVYDGVISAAALAAMAVQFEALFATMASLADCLANAGRRADADRLQRELDALKREVEQLPH